MDFSCSRSANLPAITPTAKAIKSVLFSLVLMPTFVIFAKNYVHLCGKA